MNSSLTIGQELVNTTCLILIRDRIDEQLAGRWEIEQWHNPVTCSSHIIVKHDSGFQHEFNIPDAFELGLDEVHRYMRDEIDVMMDLALDRGIIQHKE